MRAVAKHLEQQAQIRQNLDRDLFARSAFNRCYYGCFLLARNLHQQIYPGKGVPPHKALPDNVAGSLNKLFSEHIRKAARNHLLTPSEAAKIKHSVREWTRELSDLLRLGYAIRIVADYEPDTLIVTEGRNLVLGSTNLDTALRWIDRVERLCGSLISEWKSLGN